MAGEEFLATTQYADLITNPMFLKWGILFFVLAILICVGMWIYTSIAWSIIAKRRKYSAPWIAWIPLVRTAQIFEMGGFHWGWTFLWLVPGLGWIAAVVLRTIAIWRILKSEGYAEWLSLTYPLSFIPFISWIVGLAYLVIIGIVAWAKPKKKPIIKKNKK